MATTHIGNDTAETITGKAFAETLFGGGGNDTIKGMGGNDIIDGGAGDDALSGGTGFDTFLYGGSAVGKDTISGFNVTQDVIQIKKGTGGIADATTLKAAVSNSGKTFTIKISDTESITVKANTSNVAKFLKAIKLTDES